MPATLPQIQARLSEAIALRNDALDALLLILAGGDSITQAVRTQHTAKLQGYQREVEGLSKIERELLSNGRSDSAIPPRTESRSDASEALSALLSASLPSDAETAPRDTPRSDVSTAPFPAAGDGW